jgi:asparagine synthase (glutamine-hydrolysing)
MRDVLAHRGPDGFGIRCGEGVGLGHRRLSIIDLRGGAQPLSNEDGTVWVTFNGEIYNYRPLTERLARLGHRFRTRSDTEVLVHGFEEYGLDLPSVLNGIFAFAIHDVSHQRVILVRDHLGVKPLFYVATRDALFFASEIKALLAAIGHPARIRHESLQEYLVFRYVTGNNTFFNDVRRLPPGHLAVWERGTLRVQEYWHPSGQPCGVPSTHEAVEELASHLQRAVADQMISEVPLGAFCSGGMDSGLVTAYASKASGHRLKTFAVGFADPAWDETKRANDTAARFGTDHHLLRLDPEAFAALLPRLVWYNDEPLSHPNSVPLFLLSQFARRDVTVVLTGEGADELFCGYPRYHLARLSGVLDRAPQWLRRAGGGLAGQLPGHRAAKLAWLARLPLRDSLLFNSAYVRPELVSQLTGAAVADGLAERRSLLDRTSVPGDALASLSRYELLTYLGCALDRMDRMSMACSLEGRVPFLDVRLVEWGGQLPSGLKMRGVERKRVVKGLAERFLSPSVTRAAKSGFGVPLGDWFRIPAFAHLAAKLRDPSHPAARHFSQPVLRRVLDQHVRGVIDHGELLWLLTNVYVWYEVHSSGVAGVAESRWPEPMVPERSALTRLA